MTIGVLSDLIKFRCLTEKKMFDSDHECRGFTSPEGETGPSQHQDSSSSPEQDQTYYYSEPLSGNPGCVSPAGDEPLDSI
jgi:hypothetical protein